MTTSNHITLSVRCVAETLVVRFDRDSASRPFEDQLPIDNDEITSLSQTIHLILQRACHHAGGSTRDAARLKETASRLTATLLPTNVQQAIGACRAANLVLDLDRRLDWIPWELLLVESQFLCRKFAMGRVIEKSLDEPASDTHAVRKLTIVANPQFNLPAAAREADVLRRFSSLHHQMAKPVILANKVRQHDVLQALPSCDWFHFAGHAGLDNSEGEWQLADGSFGASELTQASPGRVPSFVFSNACVSGRMAGPAKASDTTGQQSSLASAFTALGTRHYLGTVAPVLDKDSLAFVEAFYRSLFEELSIGTAVAEARAATARQLGDESVLWACYVLYGDPRTALVRCDSANASTEPRVEDGFPKTCCLCSGTIKSRHGIANWNSTTEGPRPVCRDCERNEYSRILASDA